MQHIYQTKSRPVETKAFYLRVKEYYEKLWQQNQDDHYRLEALYYDLLVSPKEGYLRWKGVLKEAQIGWRKEFWGQLIGLAEGKNIQLKLRALDKAEVAFERGRLNYYQYQWVAAIEAYEKANNLFGECGHKIGQADAQKAIGDVYQSQRNYDAAIKYYDKALTILRNVGYKFDEANILKAKGDVYQIHKGVGITTQTYNAAIKAYEDALKIYRDSNDRLGEANTLKALGDVYQSKRDIEAAIKKYQEALALFSAIGDQVGQGKTLQSIGDA